MLHRSFFTSGDRKVRTIAIGGALFIFSIIAVGVWNEWRLANATRYVFDMFQDRSRVTDEEFKERVFNLAWIALLFWLIESVQPTVMRCYHMLWREAKTLWFVERWLDSESSISDADERIADGTMNITQMTVDLFAFGCRSIIVCIAFAPMLIQLSNYFSHFAFHVTGLLLWIVIAYCGLEMWLTWKIGGGDHIRFQDENRKNEAANRQELVRVQRLKHGKALRGRELTAAKKEVVAHFKTLRRGYFRSFPRSFLLDTWSVFNKQVWNCVPIVLLALAFRFGNEPLLTLGVLTQTVFALAVMRGALSLPPDSWAKISLIRTHRARLRELEKGLHVNPAQNVVVLHHDKAASE